MIERIVVDKVVPRAVVSRDPLKMQFTLMEEH